MLNVSKIKTILVAIVKMDIVENYAKIVNKKFMYFYQIILKYQIVKKIDNSCWNIPCEGCQQLYPNSIDYLCTCSKLNVYDCKSEIKRKLNILDIRNFIFLLK
jgi:hypothetical protein